MKMEQYKQQQKGIKIDEKTNEILGKELLNKSKNTPFEKEISELVVDPYVDNASLTNVYSKKIKDYNVNELLKKSTDKTLTTKEIVDAQAKGLIDNGDASKLYPFATDYVDDNMLYQKFFDEETQNPSKSYREYIRKAVKSGLKVSEVNSYWNETHPKASGGGSEKTPKEEKNLNVPKGNSGFMFLRKPENGNIIKIGVKKVNGKWVLRDDPRRVVNINSGDWVAQDSDELPRGSYERVKIDKIYERKIPKTTTNTNTTLKRVKYVPE